MIPSPFKVWTDADLARLARLMKKYPAGTPERWEKIAEIMERLPWEITKMAKRVKDVAYQVTVLFIVFQTSLDVLRTILFTFISEFYHVVQLL